ncbi:hypothetical protein BD324DRAFT_279153 [Kockovaella imperatae]|uniref:NAD(P)-binding domain-containing protein n=1 Tax=Kockovaella imperatae TaxID=4999 RepID=A0A1Y1U5V8_9TREE|nr:hypothetical protein BD324DRAFT_279153 [Kockovaella imperatae]ORX33421.1 hypothetical protein BD324DRAFT_279153 [Kockovaella imperatae]
MKVFVTGATGRLGALVTQHLVERGHTVGGLVRSEASAAKIKGPSVEPIIGSLQDLELLTRMAQSHDAVINCAFDHSGDFDKASKEEAASAQAIIKGLEGSGKKFIFTSGFMIGQDWSSAERDETFMSNPSGLARTDTERMVLDSQKAGVTPIIMRLSAVTHTAKPPHWFLYAIHGISQSFGFLPYIGDGSQRWTTCNAEDASLLYALALETAEAGTHVHAVQETITVKDLVEAVGRKTGQKTGSITAEQAGPMGLVGMLMSVDQNISSKWTREHFGWTPKGQTLLEEIANAQEGFLSNGGH